MPKITPAPLVRPLNVIAREIHTHAKDKAFYYAAEPYVDALYILPNRTLDGYYGEDKVEYVVLYLLENLGQWRGDVARRVKGELRSALAWHKLTPAQRGRVIMGA